LKSWIDEALRRMAIDSRDEAIARELHSNPAEPAGCAETFHLLVQVSPRLCEPGLYCVKAWLFGTAGPACLRSGEEKVARANLPVCLADLFGDLPRFDAAADRTWVELLLPRELLCDEVDQWRVGLDFLGDISIGVEYRVVVRSLERTSRSRAVQVLKERWRAARSRIEANCQFSETILGEGEPGGLALWIERDDCGGEAMYAALKDARTLVAAVLGCPPSPEPIDPSRDVLNTLLQAGVPVVVWVRRTPTGGETDIRTRLAELLHDRPFPQLPDRVWELRKRAACTRAEDEPIGRHLTLLWDDPSRTSPDFDPRHRLQAPTPTR
jgi:hypothetical protein